MANPNPRRENLKPLAKGFDPRRNYKGAPRKYITTLKDSGYKLAEINDCIMALLSMNLDELKTVFDNPQATVLEKTIANAMVTSLKKGSLYSLETLLSRVFGTPKQSTDVVLQTSLTIQVPDEETKMAIEKL